MQVQVQVAEVMCQSLVGGQELALEQLGAQVGVVREGEFD